LTAITGANPIAESDAGNIPKMIDAWLHWGRTKGYQWPIRKAVPAVERLRISNHECYVRDLLAGFRKNAIYRVPVGDDRNVALSWSLAGGAAPPFCRPYRGFGPRCGIFPSDKSLGYYRPSLPGLKTKAAQQTWPLSPCLKGICISTKTDSTMPLNRFGTSID